MASRCWRSRAIGLAFGASLLAPHGAFGAQDTAKRYFQNGVDLITAAQPNYQDAYYQFQLAYRESGQSWKVLGNLGLCALKLERDQEAVGFYEQYLKKGGSEIAAEERAAIEQDLLLLRETWPRCASARRFKISRLSIAAPAAPRPRSRIL